MTGFAVGERLVTFSATGAGGYASIYVAGQALVLSTEGYGIDPAVAAAVVPNAAMGDHRPARRWWRRPRDTASSKRSPRGSG